MECYQVNVIVLCFILGTLSIASSQNHGDTSGRVRCYSCHGTHSGNQSFTQCLGMTPTTCSPGQGCRIQYTNDWHRLPTIACTSSCSTDQAHTTQSRACPYGGHTTGTHTCDTCCTDDACVDQMTSSLLTHAPVICPTQCISSHAEDCWKDVNVCDSDEYCELKATHFRVLQGSCKSKTAVTRCKSDQTLHPCPSDITEHAHLMHRECTIDCCTTNECVASHFGGVYSNFHGSTVLPTTSTLATTPITTTTTTTTTTMSTTPASPFGVYAQLVQECKDHLEPGVCKDLKATQGLCQSSGSGLHLDLCPMTCGVCKAIDEANCHDTVLDGECAKLMTEKDICNGPLARYTCPMSCGLCHILVEEKLAGILAAGDDVTATTLSA